MSADVYTERLTALQRFVGRVRDAAEVLQMGYIINIHTDDDFNAVPSVLLAPGSVTYIDHRNKQEQK